MNIKLIREIAFDCYSQVNNDFNEVKFAKLIIEECINQCFSDDDVRIANHFGIDLSSAFNAPE